MTSEIRTLLTPSRVLEEARRFFTDEDSLSAATVVGESDSHLSLATFRSRLAISASPDPDGRGTRVRVSTLRRNEAVGKFLAHLQSAGSAEDVAPEG